MTVCYREPLLCTCSLRITIIIIINFALKTFKGWFIIIIDFALVPFKGWFIKEKTKQNTFPGYLLFNELKYFVLTKFQTYFWTVLLIVK